MKKIILAVLLLTGGLLPLQAQVTAPAAPLWWFGAAAGANFNFYRGSTQKLNADLTVPVAFHNGNGAGLFLAPLVEYHPAGSIWGGMMQVSYDSRNGSFNQVTTPCNCPADLKAKLSYLTIEPSLRLSPLKTRFYFFGGPRVAFNLSKSFTYSQETNPDYPGQAPNPDRKGDFSEVKKVLVSLQIGAGYDIPLSSPSSKTKFVLSPFIAFQPYFGQSPRSIESWNITTLRAGIAFKLGCVAKGAAEPFTATGVVGMATTFRVTAPRSIPVERRVRETFPLRNYIFFDTGSVEIPERYVLLQKNEVQNFKEDQLEALRPRKASGRSARQLIVYYNVLNILGSRMEKDPSSTIILVGSSETRAEEGSAMAASVKRYLVDVFGISASRISTEGRIHPAIPSVQPGGTQDLELLIAGDRRVSVESRSPGLLMEFQEGTDAPLRPVEITGVQETPLDSYVSFDVSGEVKYTSWSVSTKDEKGKSQYFGPYTQTRVLLPGKSILGTRTEGKYRITMTGTTTEGQTVKKDTTVQLTSRIAATNEESMRYSIIYEFNASNASTIYDKYLTDVVTPKIAKGATVIIHGYSDITGNATYNQELSLARANDVKTLLEKSLAKVGRSDVSFEVYGFGEDESIAPFENIYPEERFYNRTVIIDVIPPK